MAGVMTSYNNASINYVKKQLKYDDIQEIVKFK